MVFPPIRFSDAAGTDLVVANVFSDSLYQRECVAYVGAGFSRAVGMPDWRGLIEYLITGPRKLLGQTSRNAEELLWSGDLAGAASLLKASISAKDLELALNQLFGFEAYQRANADDQKIMDHRLEGLLTANWAGIITTNYDRLIEHGLNRLRDQNWIANIQNHGDPKSLGHILSMSTDHRVFFVKLHGSISGAGLVLTTQDYNDAYIRTPQISGFLTALFLRYHVVFVGCSMEDEVVRLRRRLFADFDRHLPSAFVLFPDTPASKARARLLSDQCGVEGIFYSNPDNRHLGLNVFLEEISRLPKPPQVVRQALKYPALRDRIRRLTLGNRTLLLLFAADQSASAYSCTELLEIVASREDLVNSICGESNDSRLEHIIKSRLQHLAVLNLLIEVEDESAENRYQVSPKLDRNQIRSLISTTS